MTSAYWPDEPTCERLVTSWAEKLYEVICLGVKGWGEWRATKDEAQLDEISKRYDFIGDEDDPESQWIQGTRRYGYKSNQLVRVVFLLGIDPEARWRHRGWSEQLIVEALPEHVERYVNLADMLCGIRCGVSAGRMTEEHFYRTDQSIDEADVFCWCVDNYKKFITP